MSANKIRENVFIHSVNGYNFYTIIAEGKKYIIGGIPEEVSDTYISEAITADGIIILTSKPEFCGGIKKVIKAVPDIEVYATPAGLRNIKEIINTDVNEKLIKDFSELAGIKFIITPNVHWVDTVSAMYCGVLFSGEMFSGGDDFKEYYYNKLSVNRGFVRSALKKLEAETADIICPSFGGVHSDPRAVFDEYNAITAEITDTKKQACVIYSSRYGFTKLLAEFARDKLSESFSVSFFDADTVDSASVVECINESCVLLIGTNTVNRNAPQKIWDIITRPDLVNKRGMPYFVFGSFCWAGDGIKLVDKTLSAMGLRQVTKPVEVLLNPSDDDFVKLGKAVGKIVEYTNSDQ